MKQFLALIAFLVWGAVAASIAEEAKVARVIDGDTCVLEGEIQVRYLGINAPEQGDPLGDEATKANNELVSGKSVRLESRPNQVDRDGRRLAYVFVEETCINEELIRQGFAHVKRPVASKYILPFLKAQAEARTAGRGIWANVAKWQVQIASVHAKAEISGKDKLLDEYIVIENLGDEAIDMTGWTVSDEANHRYLFPNFNMPAKAKVTLRTGVGKNNASELFWGSRRAIWNDAGDTIFVRDAENNLILSHVY